MSSGTVSTLLGPRNLLVVRWSGAGWYGETERRDGALVWTWIHDDKASEPDRLDDERYADYVAIEWLDSPPLWADQTVTVTRKRRPGGGRPRLTPGGTVRKTITLTLPDAAYLAGLHKSTTQAVRLLVAWHREQKEGEG